MSPRYVGNPIVTDTYTSDPTVLVHDGTAYLYTGHDEAEPDAQRYVMHNWSCFSSTNMRTWTSHGPKLAVGDFAWARDSTKGAWFGAFVDHHGRYWWYLAMNHATVPGGAIGVAVADHPTGPFRDALGHALVTNDQPYHDGRDHTNDPWVLVHDGQAYLYWGKYGCFSARLDDSMTALAGPITEIELPAFEEGVHVHERDGWFYLSFGHRYPQRVAYARSRHPRDRGRSRGSSTRCRATAPPTGRRSSSSTASGSSSTTTACCPAAAATGARCAPTA